MNSYFSIKLLFYLNLICLTVAQDKLNGYNTVKTHDPNDLIIDEVELKLNSTDKEKIFYCSSRVEFDKQRENLTVSIDKPILSPPEFIIESEQANSTAIRIRIIPNGYIGVNRIHCHWSNRIAEGQAVDLIIGAKPGLIQLREPCQAYDRLYVHCKLYAPTIARAFRNGFPRLFKFDEMGYEQDYSSKIDLVNITDDDYLIFNFTPRDKYRIQKRTPFNVMMNLSRFGSSSYQFKIEPIHVTQVNFRIGNISNDRLIVLVDHSLPDFSIPRLCAGSVKSIENGKVSATVMDIDETSSHIISINRLRPLTDYKICLRCYYEKTDESFKTEVCQSAKTKQHTIPKLWIIGGLFAAGSIMLTFILSVGCKKKLRNIGNLSCCGFCKKKSNLTRTNGFKTDSGEIERLPTSNSSDEHYSPEPVPFSEIPPFNMRAQSRTGSIDNVSNEDHQFSNREYKSLLGENDQLMLDDKYQPIANLMDHTSDQYVVAPDTFDLRSSKHT